MRKPQKCTIKVSKETLKLIKEWSVQLKTATLEETILLSMKWSQDLNGSFVMSQIEMRDRLIQNESWVKSNSMHLVRFSNQVTDNTDKVLHLENLVDTLQRKFESLEKIVMRGNKK